MSDLTIADLDTPSRALAEQLVQILLDEPPTGEEPLHAILEYALQALVTNHIRPVIVPGEDVRWTVG